MAATPREGARPPLPITTILVIGGGAFLVIGEFLPWLTATAAFVGSVPRSGLDYGDSVGTLALGRITVLIGVADCVLGVAQLDAARFKS